jgi:hypothetical protein
MDTRLFSCIRCNEEKFVGGSDDTEDFLFDFTQYQGSTISTGIASQEIGLEAFCRHSLSFGAILVKRLVYSSRIT